MGQRKKRRPRAPVNKVTSAFRVSDALWTLLQRVLPKHRNTHRFGGGKPRTPDRRCADAIFYVLRTGWQWGALDATDLCPHSTAHDRFQQWVAAGVFLKLWQVGVEQFDELKGIDWRWLSMDGAMTKAPLGGEKNGRQPHRSRQTRGQTQPADRGAWRAAGRGSGRRQSAGHETGGLYSL
jgi:transposase